MTFLSRTTTGVIDFKQNFLLRDII